MTDINRRRALQLVGSSGLAGIAGCNGLLSGNPGSGDDGSDGGTTTSSEVPPGTPTEVETQYYHQWEGGRNENDMGYKMTAEPGKAVEEMPCEFSPEQGSWLKEHALMLAKGFNELGVPGTTVSNPFSKLVDGWVQKGLNYPVVMIALNANPQRAADPHAFFGRVKCGSSNNFQNYCNPEMTELVDRQLQENDPERRQDLIAQCQKLYVEDESQGWTFFPEILSPVNTDAFSGYFPMPGAGMSEDYFPWGFLTIQPETDRTTFIKGTTRQMDRPNFMWGTSGLAATWMRIIWDGLFDIGPNLDVVPALATSAEFVDETTVEVELRDDVTWHDGEPFGPDDVVWTTETFMNPAAPNVAAYWESFEEETPVEVLSTAGGGTVRFNLKTPDARFPTQGMVRSVILPKHQWQDADNPSEFEPDPPIGTGFLSWNTWQPGERFELDVYEDHWLWDDEVQKEYLGEYYTEGDGIDKVVWVNTGNIDSSIGALKQGDIDAISSLLSVSQAQQAAEASNVELLQAKSFVAVTAGVDHTIPLIRDKEFRIAYMRYSWNVEEFVQNVMQGYGTIPKSNNPIAENSPWYTDDTIPREYNIEKGRSLLRKAGYTWDNQGRLHYPDGEAWAAFVERTKPGNTNRRRTELGQKDFS